MGERLFACINSYMRIMHTSDLSASEYPKDITTYNISTLAHGKVNANEVLGVKMAELLNLTPLNFMSIGS